MTYEIKQLYFVGFANYAVTTSFLTSMDGNGILVSLLGALIWPVLLSGCVVHVVAGVFTLGAFSSQQLDHLAILTVSLIGFIPYWLLIEDETGVPPGIRFLSNFYRHPAHRAVDRAAGSEYSPTFDVAAFQAAIDRNPSHYGRRLQVEELNKMKQTVADRTAKISANEARLAESERRQAAIAEARRKEERADAEAELEVLRAAEELEKAKARLEERRKQR